jgi:ribosomal protein S12 methylthiotransferase accessory factor
MGSSKFTPSPVSHITGIVHYITQVELNRGDPSVFVAASQGPDMRLLGFPSGANISGSGAGLSIEVASGAAIGECLERYSACIVDEENCFVDTCESLLERGCNAHNPQDWALFDPSQTVPYPMFSRETPIKWTRGWELLTKNDIYVPSCMTYLSSSDLLRAGGAKVLCPSVSTGCACSTLSDDSVLKGLFELIERDAFMIIWRSELRIPEVEIDRKSNLYAVFQNRFARAGLDYRIWQTTMDLGVPSFFGMLTDNRGGRPRTIVGGAAHCNPETAVLKTLCELVQGLTWMDFYKQAGNSTPIKADEIRTFTDRAVLYAFNDMSEAFAFLKNNNKIALSSINPWPTNPTNALMDCVLKLTSLGFNPAAIDITSNDVRECGFTVTRVVIPGLETMDGNHSLQLLGGTRWRDIPVKLGFSATPTSLESVNKIPHPYP